MQLPSSLLQSLRGVPGFEQEAFEQVHGSAEQVTTVRINPAKWGAGHTYSHTQHAPFNISGTVPWSQYGYYLSQRPSFTFDPLFHAGLYYVQEASSMFLEQALMQTTDLSQPLQVLDLCAAPGGKSTHLQSLINERSVLVSNEVIKSRAGVLKQNILKWGAGNVVVTNNDPQHIGRMQGFFDVMVVDAPCSGSGLFRRDVEAINEWSEDAVLMCCGRQKRILGDALPALKEGGVLIYSTCSYSREEDEDIADWLVTEMGLKGEQVKINEDWGIVETASPQKGAFGYRFFPDKVKGEGFYIAVFRKESGDSTTRLKAARLDKATAKESAVVKGWLQAYDVEILKHYALYVIPLPLMEAYSVIRHYLNIVYAGVAVGEVMKEKLVPDHALALSPLLSKEIPVTDVDLPTAIRYLQRGELNIQSGVKGWQTLSYKNYNLGWINALQNRVNNYYPKELRILKQWDNAAFEK